MIARTPENSNTTPTRELLLMTYFAFRRDYGQLLNGRNARAYRIASNGDVSQVDENTWKVKAATNGRAYYIVAFNPMTHHCPGWSCNCPDCDKENGGHAPVMAFCGGFGPICKHIVAVAMVWAGRIALPLCDCPDAPPASAPARINGKQVKPFLCPRCGSDNLAGNSRGLECNDCGYRWYPEEECDPDANGNGRRTTCKCGVDWQECDCPAGQLPEPARITTPENINEPLTVAEQRAAARNANGIKQEAGRRPGADFGNPQRW